MKSPKKQEKLWKALSLIFEEDDGSLPDVCLKDLSPASAARIFDELRNRAEPLQPHQTVWFSERDVHLRLSEVPDAGTLAAEGKAWFHVLLRGIESHGVRLPDLGVGVWPDMVALDYGKGKEWNEETLAAFVELLGDLLRFESGGRLETASTTL